MKGFMMKRQKSIAMAGLLAASLCCSSNESYAGNNDGFVAGMCAAGAALFGVAGAVALADWCFSETDDQMIARIQAECQSIDAQHRQTMTYFERITGANVGLLRMDKPFVVISESSLHDFATYIWHTNSTQYAYRSNITSAQSVLTSSLKKLRKRINALNNKCYHYEDQQRLRQMRQLLFDAQELMIHVGFMAYSLDYHKAYFNLYDTVDTVRSRYLTAINIFEAKSYSVASDIKRYVLSNYNCRYPLRTFVSDLASDISSLKSDIRALGNNYPLKKQHVNGLVDVLASIKAIIMNDSLYAQETYEWEQARLLEQQRLAFEAQARAERQRLDALLEQNRILEERNRIERQKMYNNYAHNTCCDDVNVTINFTI